VANPPLSLVVMAAGMGSRYKGLKQIAPVGPNGEIMLDYSVFDAQRAGFSRVVFVIRREIEETFRTLMGRRFEQRLDVHYVCQELASLPSPFQVPLGREKPWGTGHALLCATAAVEGPCAVINADDFYGGESYRVLAEFLPQADAQTYAMAGYRLDQTLSEHGTVARGLCRTDAHGFLASVEELTAIEKLARGARHKEHDGRFRPLTGEEIVSVNCWGFTPSIGPHLRRLFTEFLGQNTANPKAEFFIPTAINGLIQAGLVRVKVLPTTATWFGVTYREDRPVVMGKIRALIQAGEYPEKLWE
jgi:hypothetical protein